MYPKDKKLIRLVDHDRVHYNHEYSGEKLLFPLKNTIMWDYENVNGDRINGIVNICINFSCFDKCITVKTESEKNKIRKNKNSKFHSRNTDLVFSIVQKKGEETVPVFQGQGQDLRIGN